MRSLGVSKDVAGPLLCRYIMKATLRIGSRPSKLAIIQAEIVSSAIVEDVSRRGRSRNDP